MMNHTGSFSVEKLENSDGVKRLYRNMADLVRRLDSIVKHGVEDLFASETSILRIRLRDCCERLMFVDPVNYGKKAEDLLWRKVFYDVIVAAKQQWKTSSRNGSYPAALLNHLAMGTGTYHHLLFRIHTEYSLEEGAADFIYTEDCQVRHKPSEYFKLKAPEDSKKLEWAKNAFHRCLVCLGDLARYRQDVTQNSCDFVAERYYAQAAAFNPCLGMPHNQQGTLAGASNYGCDAAYHYMRCLVSNQSFEGSEENLERILERGQKLLNQCSFEPMMSKDVAENMKREVTVKRCLTRFLKFCEVCFMEDKIFHSSVQLEQLCQQVLQDFYDCMQFHHQDILAEDKPSERPQYPLSLESRLVFRLVVMALMCVQRLSDKGSSSQSAAIAFSLALFSHLLHYVVVRLEKALGIATHFSDFPNVLPEMNSSRPNGDSPVVESLMTNTQENSRARPPRNRNRNRLLRRRRQRRGSCISLEDSDLSEGNHSEDGFSDSDDGCPASDISEGAEMVDRDGSSSEDDTTQDLDCSSVSLVSHSMSDILFNGESDDKCDGDNVSRSDSDGKKNNQTNSSEKSPKSDRPNLSPRKVLAAVEEEDLLLAVKICTDWLRCHPNIFTACAQGSQLLWSRVATMLNMLHPVLHLEAKGKNCVKPDVISCARASLTDDQWVQHLPLPEDVALRGFSLLHDIQRHLKYKEKHHLWLSCSEQAVIRVACLHQFGLTLTKCAATNLVYDSSSRSFRKNVETVSSGGPSWPATDQEHKHAVEVQRKHLMENMAHLWLQAEVTELESTMRSTSHPQLSPYLVLTTSVLTDHSATLRQLLSTKRFIVVIPVVVIQHLDWLKKDSLQAREAIRWLEAEFHRGNRYLRAQKQHEQISLSPIKYPKRKDKEAWDYFQVLECCKYLAQQSHFRDTSSSLVTLLVGSTDQAPPTGSSFNMDTLALSTGIKLEHIEVFLSKWQNTAKCHR